MVTTRDAVRCAFESCLLVDRAGLARLVATGPDILPLLQRLGTGDVASLQAGDGGRTVLTTNKGRIVQHLFVSPMGDAGVLLVGGTDSAPGIHEHLNRYIFAEKIGLTDASENLFHFTLTGPASAELLESLGLAPPGAGRSVAGRIEGRSVRVVGHDGWTTEGYSLIGESAARESVRSFSARAVEGRGGCVGEETALDVYRVLRGIPAAGHELTLDYNPLEAGLWDAVSFDKGCYVGQEVVARLRTYDKISRSIVGLELGNPADLPATGSALTSDARRVGSLTSALRLPGDSRAIGLGYIKRKQLRPELTVGIDGSEAEARIVELPFVL